MRSAPKRSSSRTSSDDAIQTAGRRKRSRINYAEVENNFPQIGDGESDEDNEEVVKSEKENDVSEEEVHNSDDDDDDDDGDFEETPKKQRHRQNQAMKQRSKPAHASDDDASFESESEDESELASDYDDNFTESEKRRVDRQFVTKDDDDESDDYAYDSSHNRKAKKKLKNKSRSIRREKTSRKNSSRRSSKRRVISDDEDPDTSDHHTNEPMIEEEEFDDIQQEIEDLKGSDDETRQTRARRRAGTLYEDDGKPRSLRERKKDVNYAIPPPLNENLEGLNADPFILAPSTPRRRGAASKPVWSLFPTGGPFGGGDVTSIFGKNYPGATGNGSLLAAGADDDSSDDEILPVNGTSNKRSSISAPVPTKFMKKKQTTADSDPLGVDMNIDFSAVGGLDNYIYQLKEMVALPLLYPEVYEKYKITPPRGVLFHGPPGTGKTLMARALASSFSSGDKKITFFMRKGADCLSKWVGEAERQLRLLFEEAKKQQPSIIFFDEIDGLAPVRSSKQEQIHASIVSTMLALMDGMDNRGQVIVIGATNRPDAVDPALRRPGRFDREFYFPLPDIKSRKEILQIHTKKWEPPLSNEFLSKIAEITKGYGGADLRALCTEAALNSIQRRYPQIYSSNEKLKIDPSTITVSARDFMKAVEKIVPSSTRSTSSGSAPLPEHLTSLLKRPLEVITHKLDKLIPRIIKLTSLEEAQFVDPTENDTDGGFAKQEFVKLLEASRIHRPRLLITGLPGNGQQYLGSAVLNHLEGFNVQSLDLGTLFSDPTRTPENAIIQSFIEARRHKPSIIYIPNIDIWFDTIPESAKSTLAGLLRTVSSNERILLLGLAETEDEELHPGLKHLFGISDSNYVNLELPTERERKAFFQPLWDALKLPPSEYLDTRKKRKLEKLEVVKVSKEEKAEDLKSLEKSDMRLKNTLKIKLSGLMDLFKNRYRKFKKPIIEPVFLVHLFEPIPNGVAPAYTKEGDMILEVTTGRRYFNMDLDTIEERLWNGFYSEPKQFLKDIEMIYSDSVTSQDRERLIKASEMLANAQVGIEEIATPDLIQQCKGLRQREILRLKKYEEERATMQKLQEAAKPVLLQEITDSDFTNPGNLNGEATASGLPVVPEDGELPDATLLELQTETNPFLEPDAPNGDQSIIVDPVTAGIPLPSAPVVETVAEEPSGGPIVESMPEPTASDEPQEDEEAEEPQIPNPPFELDENRMEQVARSLVDESSGLTVEYLEQVNAKLMDVLWEDHHEWNRNPTLEKINTEISKVKQEFRI